MVSKGRVFQGLNGQRGMNVRNVWCRVVRMRVATLLSLPVAWLPMTASPLATDAARIVSKLDTFGKVVA